MVFINEYERYILSKDERALSPSPPIDGEYQLTIPGETLVPGWKVKAEIFERKEIKNLDTGDPYTSLFDFDRTGNELSLRTIKRGDRLQPLGMNDVKKVGRFLIDARVPRYSRKSIPVVASPEQIYWVVGQRIDERVKVTGKTKRVLRLRFKSIR